MATIPANPYYDLTAVRSPDMFFGRTRLLNSLFSTIANRQSISLVGPRNIGKSSVLKYICLPAIQQASGYDLRCFVFVLVDLRDYLHKTSDNFFEAVSRHIVSQCQGRLEITQQAQSGVDEFNAILELVTERGFHIVLLMDAFDNITRNKRFDPEFFSFLRACATAGKVSYVTASRSPLYEVCHNAIKESPFFNIFSTRSLGPLTQDEARELILVPSRRVGYPFTEAEAEWVLTLAGKHPFFVQRVCHKLFEERSLQNSDEVDLESVQMQAYDELRPHFEDMWERLDEKHQLQLKDEVRGLVSSHVEMPELSESALFCQFVREKCNIQLFQMTVEELEQVLDKIEDARFLGESGLRHLKVVAQRIPKAASLSAIERGRVIREVLGTAHEQLRGNGIRTDTSLEWRLYNILYYRYFKRHLKNEVISVKLEFTSIRQYYRERSKAIETLLNALLEMEASANGKGN